MKVEFADADPNAVEMTQPKEGAASGKGKNDKAIEEPAVSISQLFRFATAFDWLLMFFGMITSTAVGAAQPAIMVLFGDVMDTAGGSQGSTEEELKKSFNEIAVKMLVLGAAVTAAAWIGQGARWRKYYLRGILKQDVSWYDTGTPEELSSRIAESTQTLEDGISTKISLGARYAGQGLGGVIVSFYYSWDMALVLMGLSPIVIFGTWFLSKATTEAAGNMSDAYAKAGGIASETIGALRTVASLNAERKQAAKYHANLVTAEKAGIRKSYRVGFGNGLLFASANVMAAVGFIYGAYKLARELDSSAVEFMGVTYNCQSFNIPAGLVARGDAPGNCGFTAGDMIIALFALQMGAQGLGLIEPTITALAKARKAAAQMMSTTEHKPVIDAFDPSGEKPSSCKGRITFDDVHFTYPSRPDNPVCKGYSLVVEPGQTVALVGQSGSGKSTAIQLMERFYDPSKGSVALDGVDLRDLNVTWLRQQIGLVSQEPTLFSGTIAENIAYGKEGATREEIEAAARMANAHNFIMEFPDGYDTDVGASGDQLSGGQKQRVAIARAMIKNPTVLLLDEATSALDNESERVVQEALDKLVKDKQRSTIVIAHRLTTIRNADKICVVHDGRIVEQGTHDELIALDEPGKEGFYYKLNNQHNDDDSASDEEAKEEDMSLPGQPEHQGEYMSIKVHRKSGSISVGKRRSAGEIDARRPSAGLSKEEQKEDEKAKKAEKKAAEAAKKALVSKHKGRIWKLYENHHGYFTFGFIGALLVGGANPGVGVIFVKSIGLFYYDDPEIMRDDAVKWALIMIAISLGQIIGDTWRYWGFGVPGERVTVKLRQMFYDATMRQEIGWHDLPENAPGKLCANLASEVQLIQSLTGEAVGRNVLMLATLICAFTFSFVFGYWAIILVSLACVPIMMSGFMIELALMSGGDGTGEKEATLSGEAGRIVSEVVSSVRTISSFTLEQRLLGQFVSVTDAKLKKELPFTALKGFFVGYAQGSLFAAFSLLYWFGGQQIANGNANFEEMMIPIFCMFMLGAGMGQAANGATDQNKAMDAAARVFAVIDRKSEIDFTSHDGKQPAVCQGRIEFNNVYFTYPSRPDQRICNGYSFVVEPGQTVALVGQSGSGKSTAIQLMERFYDPDAGDMGKVELDGIDIKELNITWLRQQIGLVSQEPTLFSGTIAENIAYGKEGATREEIEAAARMANAHNFIMEFPDGYDTDVGSSGDQLSGGQKQRVAIARAMIKNPTVLLLDEATSALDNESERVVQEALDNLVKDKQRSTIVIAHRLTTIRNADKICVVNKGRIAEQGTHEELMALGAKGLYHKLVRGSEH